MVQSQATTVAEYLGQLDESKRSTIQAVRQTILENLPPGYEENMSWGMIAYEVPLSVVAKTYNDKPLLYCSLAAQKRHFAVYLMNMYSDKALEAELIRGFETAGKKLDMGKCCVRFKRLEDLPLEVIGRIVAATPMDQFIDIYHRSRGGSS